ncbi:hypothetical protein [Streptomyces violascens]|uniref:Proteinase inhibitor I42 chagasin domain-containing protein n=1 Tax=Streptomyces violascens TaxID=67381 RepID=A0ABQ3QXZ9_9ACTN|nr:hypothetical protein [Streptomyces violascens]GGU18608.1 hypothetical protein GCM10010289_45380 [Streptomyces violascens]GHI42130.1 hypothetical protein Sviol_65380 [Streptomyces violascens]
MKKKASTYLAVPLALGLASAASTGAAPAAAQPHLPSAHHAAAAKRVVLTNSDDGRPVVLAVGDDVEIRLTGSRSQGLNYTWGVPQAGDSGALRRTAGGTAPTGGASAVFHAEKPGVVMIGSTRSCRPDPGRVCPDVVVPWNVTAKVT